jgi:glycosyltransferase involved in cell wall biosynthesis
VEIASVRLRCLLPSRYLRAAGWASELLDTRDAHAYDVVVFQKIYDDEAIELARSLRYRGVRTVFDLCDNHLYIPVDRPELAERAARLRRMLECVDVVSVASEPLRELIPEYEALVVDDVLDEFEVTRTLRMRSLLDRVGKARSLDLVWFGNAGEASPSFGLAHLPKIVPALNELHRSRSLRLTVMSNSPEACGSALANARFPSRYVEWRYESFPRLFAQNDICVIPIELNPFSVCKTANRIALSLRLGVPVVADRIPSFDDFADFVLFDRWPENVSQYAESRALRRMHVDAGRRYVAARYTPERAVAQWSAVLERALSTDSHDTLRPPGMQGVAPLKPSPERAEDQVPAH